MMSWVRRNKTNKINDAIIKTISLVLILVLGLGVAGCSGKDTMKRHSLVVDKDISQSAFKEFYYTYSSTAYPPEFQRYYFYTENDKHMFYHEKREGDKVFLEEEDITFSGRKELTDEEWNTFWDFLSEGCVNKRKESTESGGAGPWLYIYWNGDKDVYQEFSFDDYETVLSFEEFCIGLKDSSATEIDTYAAEESNDVVENDSVEDFELPDRANKVVVSNVSELLEAIASDTEIVLREGEYNLTGDMDIFSEEEFAKWESSHENVMLYGFLEGFEVDITGVEGLTLISEDDAPVSIVTDTRHADVLNFSFCSDIIISGITIGHTPERGKCEGAVLEFAECSDITLRELDLYGCGTYGVAFNNVDSLKLMDSVIRDCSYGIISGSMGTGFEFTNCEMRDCDGYTMLDVSGLEAKFTNCNFDGNEVENGMLHENLDNNKLVFVSCSFGEKEAEALKESAFPPEALPEYIDCSPEELNN